MSSNTTVVFADIAGSTALFEALGNEQAAALVTRLTRGIGTCVQDHGGRVVKKLGDGVLGVFAQPDQAVAASVALMREHRQWLQSQPQAQRVEIHVGLASGEVVEVDGDCYGDAVNVAARLCDLAGGAEVWATRAVVSDLRPAHGVNFIRLGHVEVRGKAEAQVMYQVEWREDEEADCTVHSDLMSELDRIGSPVAEIQLAGPDGRCLRASSEEQVQVGRAPESDLCLADPRVSRVHARVEWRQGAFVLTDLSSFGTWVRFKGSEAPVQLRRDNCLLHGSGEISLGVSFADSSAPVVSFQVSDGGMVTA
ncbi:MAG TPA: adenylate/guanylate cyclase domain-containing protein [Alicycliphilus sp.]|nr:adenylate/guanylate cyclase domain-containing protein [Alicycliphilus sp.]